jgi:hypothetical protein
MSMNGQFVQVTPQRLAQLLARPDSVVELFQTPAGNFTEPMRQVIQRGEERLKQAAAGGQLAQMLAASLGTLDPRMRQMLEQRLGSLGVNVEGLKGGQGGEAILKLMEQRLPPLSFQAGPPPGSQGKPEDQGKALSIDKAWHGVHYLLCGEGEPGATLLSQAILGGTDLGEDQGYGPARYFPVEQVAKIACELSRTGLEAEMRGRLDPGQMSRLGIYPGGWDHLGGDWLFEEFRRLRDFYSEAAARGFAIVTCIT